MTDLTTETIETLRQKLNALSAQRDAYIASELGLTVTAYVRANTSTPLDGIVGAIASEISRREFDAAQAAFAAEWTMETFTSRRATWNAESAKLPRSAKGIAWADLRDLEAKLGYTMDDLKRAKSLLGVA